MEVFQFSYDGDQFRVTGEERVSPSELVSGWNISNGGLTNAIADGEDLLVGMHASKVDGTGSRNRWVPADPASCAGKGPTGSGGPSPSSR